MDAIRFAVLVQFLAAAAPRRGLIRLLATLPLAGGLAALLGAEDAAADGRRRRRKKRHKHGRGRRRKHHKGKRKKNKTCAGDVCASGCPYSSIQAAIDDPAGPTTIRLCAETYPGTITINKDLTLIGAGDGEDGTIMDGQQNGSVVTVNIGSVELKGLRITGGSGDSGGGIDNIGNSVILTDCSVTGNVAGNFGGGISSTSGTVTLNGASSVSGNTVTGDVGQGGGIANLSGTVTLNDDSRVADNEAADAGGGIDNTSGTVILNGASSVSGNTATGSLIGDGEGGGIHNDSGIVTLNDDSSVTGNMAADSGGGISNVRGTVTLNNDSSVSGNRVTDGDDEGGGIYCYRFGTVTLNNNSSVTANQPDDCAGDGTYSGKACGP
jgi:nitrous oxidase accessory protein NosD